MTAGFHGPRRIPGTRICHGTIQVMQYTWDLGAGILQATTTRCREVYFENGLWGDVSASSFNEQASVLPGQSDGPAG